MQRPMPSGEPLADVQSILRWMRHERMWPNGPRYLFADAFGVVLLVSLYRADGGEEHLREAQWVVSEVDRVLGRERGIGIAEDRDGQYFHHLAMWLYALGCLGEIVPDYQRRAVELAQTAHRAFVRPGRGVLWKMTDDLSGPYPGYGYGAIDPFHGYVVYRLLDAAHLSREIDEMREIVQATSGCEVTEQDLGLGLMLWLGSFFPDEPWARRQRMRAVAGLERLWVDPPGYFCRAPGQETDKHAFANYGISIGLKAAGFWEERRGLLHDFFRYCRSSDPLDAAGITHVMGCCSLFPGELVPGHAPAARPGPAFFR